MICIVMLFLVYDLAGEKWFCFWCSTHIINITELKLDILFSIFWHFIEKMIKI